LNEKPTQPFSRQVSITFVARLVLVANSVLTGALLARWLGAEGVGIYAVVSLTVNTLVQSLGSGLASANVFFAKRKDSQRASILVNSIAFATIAGVGAAALTYIVSRVRPDWFHDIPSELLLIALISLPFQLCTLLVLNLFLAFGDVRKFNLLDVCSQVYLLVNAIIVLLLLRSDLHLLFGLNTIAGGLIATVLILMARRSIINAIGDGRFAPDVALFSRMMRFGIRINIMNAALALILRADVLLVNYFRGEAEAGVYSIAAQCSLLLIMFPNVVGTMLFPNVAEMGSSSTTFTARVIRHAAAIQLLMCLAAIPAAFLLPVVYGSSFSPATSQFLLLLPGTIFLGLQMMLSQHLVGVGRIGIMPLFWMAAVILAVSLDVLLIPAFGATAAAAVSSATYAFIFALTLFYFMKVSGEKWSDILIVRAGELRQLFQRP